MANNSKYMQGLIEVMQSLEEQESIKYNLKTLELYTLRRYLKKLIGIALTNASIETVLDAYNIDNPKCLTDLKLYK